MSRMEGVKKRCTKHGKEKREVVLLYKKEDRIDPHDYSLTEPIKVWYCPKCHDIKMREDE